MAKLFDLAATFRSKNAGPFMFTVDMFFTDEKAYKAVKESNILTKEFVAERYKMPLEYVYGIYYLDDCMAVKVSLYKQYIAGDPDNRDVFTSMKQIPLYDVEIDID